MAREITGDITAITDGYIIDQLNLTPERIKNETSV